MLLSSSPIQPGIPHQIDKPEKSNRENPEEGNQNMIHLTTIKKNQQTSRRLKSIPVTGSSE